MLNQGDARVDYASDAQGAQEPQTDEEIPF
jgi:hypothetical protein